MALLTIYNDLVSQIEAIVDADGKRVINKVGFWNNQFGNEAVETSFNYPAVFIEFSTIEWDLKMNAGGFNTDVSEEQSGLPSVVTLHIGHSHLEDTDISFPLLYAINQQVYFAVQNSVTSLYGPMLRTSERTDTNHDRVLDWQMDFRVTFAQTGQSINKTEIASDTIAIVLE